MPFVDMGENVYLCSNKSFYNVKLSNYEEIQFFCRYDPVGCQLLQ